MVISGKKVLISMTGRSDSAVAAFLLKKQGFDVIGLALTPSSVAETNTLPTNCYLDNLEQIKGLCDQIGISFFVSDIHERFEDEVIDPMLSQSLYLKDSPICFNCTQLRIKILYEKMKQLKADAISTGHYCKVQMNLQTGKYYVQANQDPKSDQSHLLSGIPSEYLEKLILPLGDLRKEEVVAMAKKFSFKLNQSGIDKRCFADKKYRLELAVERLPKKMMHKGQVIHENSEDVVGSYEKQISFSLMDKNLEGVNRVDKELCVTGFKKKTREILVGPEENLYGDTVVVEKLEFTSLFNRRKSFVSFVRFGERPQLFECIVNNKASRTLVLLFKEKVGPIIQGRNIVFYDKDKGSKRVIGSGIMAAHSDFELVDRVAGFREDSEEEYTKTFFEF